MKRISVEQALVWAYRDQMVHVALPAGVPVEASQGYSPGMSEGTFLADKIDSGVKLGFGAAPDAYAIHAVVMRQQPLMIARGHSEMEMLYARRLMKNDYDSMDHRGTGDASKPFPTVQLLPRALVQEHAMAASRPDRVDDPVAHYEKGPRVYMSRQGHVVTHHTRFGFTMVNMIGDDPLEVIAVRRRYAVWHGALSAIRNAVAEQLRSIVLTDDMPPPALPC